MQVSTPVLWLKSQHWVVLRSGVIWLQSLVLGKVWLWFHVTLNLGDPSTCPAVMKSHGVLQCCSDKRCTCVPHLQGFGIYLQSVWLGTRPWLTDDVETLVVPLTFHPFGSKKLLLLVPIFYSSEESVKPGTAVQSVCVCVNIFIHVGDIV